MPRLASLLKLKRNPSLTEEDLRTKCTKCGKRSTTGQDGLCDQCRFDEVLNELTDER